MPKHLISDCCELTSFQQMQLLWQVFQRMHLLWQLLWQADKLSADATAVQAGVLADSSFWVTC